MVAAGAEAATFVVNSPADVPDANLDGVCETAVGNGICTLRAAIQEANAHAGADTISLQSNVTYLLTRVGAEDAALNGDLDILDSVTITGAGPASTIIDGNGAVTGERVFQIVKCIGNAPPAMDGTCSGNAYVVVSMSGVTIQHGASTNMGGGIFNVGALSMQNCAVIDNTANGLNDWGGGIYNSGTLNLISSTVSNNTTGAHNAYGGGIFNQGAMTITNSTISGNSTFAGASSPGYGGGIYDVPFNAAAAIVGSTISGNTGAYGGGIRETGTLVMINSTISGNFSTVSGGGLFANSGTTGLYNVTVTGNVANSDGAGSGFGGGLATAGSAVLTFQNSIVALNNYVIDQGQFDIIDDDDCTGTVTSNGFSIMYANNSGTCTVNGSPVYENPGIGPLQNNGGATQTHALLTGSPAIDGGNTSGCTDNLGAPLTTDQRGLPRPIGAHCDIGAYEVQPDVIFKNGFQT